MLDFVFEHVVTQFLRDTTEESGAFIAREKRSDAREINLIIRFGNLTTYGRDSWQKVYEIKNEMSKTPTAC